MITDGRVVAARRVAQGAGLPTAIAAAFGVVIKRAIADGGVAFTDSVEIQRELAVGRVEIAFGIAK